MKSAPLLCALLGSAGLAGCMIGDVNAPPPGGGSNPGAPDAGPSSNNPDAPPASATCTLDASLGTLGTMANATAQMYNVPGSQGKQHFYRAYAMVPGTTPADYVEVILVDGKGPFANGLVAPGTYPIAGADTNIGTCGVCVLAMGDVDATSGLAKQVYMAQSGSVTVTTVGAAGTTLAVSVSGLGLAQYDLTAAATSGTCASQLGSADLAGSEVAMSGNGTGGTTPAGIAGGL